MSGYYLLSPTMAYATQFAMTWSRFLIILLFYKSSPSPGFLRHIDIVHAYSSILYIDSLVLLLIIRYFI